METAAVPGVPATPSVQEVAILLETNSSAFVMLISVLVNFRCFHWVWNLG